MKINATQLEQVNNQIQKLIKADSFYGKRLKEHGITGGIGFTLSIVLFASIRERLFASAECPKCFEGFPIALISASLMAMAFLGFSGMKIW